MVDVYEKDFIKVFDLGHSKFHFKPEKISSMTDTQVTIEGYEAISNQKLGIKISQEQFNNLCVNFPNETKVIVDRYEEEIKEREIQERIGSRRRSENRP